MGDQCVHDGGVEEEVWEVISVLLYPDFDGCLQNLIGQLCCQAPDSINWFGRL